MLKRNKRYHIDIINSLCIELREYFYAFFYCDKNITQKVIMTLLKSINLEHGGKIQSTAEYKFFLISLYKST